MEPIIDIFHATVPPERVARLLEVRAEGVEALRARCPGLLRAELVRLDETTWVDLLVWRDAAAAEEAAVHFPSIPALGEMHAIAGEPTAYERGTIEHSTWLTTSSSTR